jgi:hypothetical protein
VLPAIQRELENLTRDLDIKVTFLSPGLHIECGKMEREILQNLDSIKREKTKGEKILLLYGAMCHEKLMTIAEDNHAALPSVKNCIEMILSPEKKKALDESGNIFYLTSGWLRYWREIVQERSAAASCDKIIVLDAGDGLISEEELLEFFDFMQIPVESVAVTLDYFRETLRDACGLALKY